MKSPFLSAKESSGERGAILVVVLVLVFAVTLALLAYRLFVRLSG